MVDRELALGNLIKKIINLKKLTSTQTQSIHGGPGFGCYKLN
jgi:hypothetical protein